MSVCELLTQYEKVFCIPDRKGKKNFYMMDPDAGSLVFVANEKDLESCGTSSPASAFETARSRQTLTIQGKRSSTRYTGSKTKSQKTRRSPSKTVRSRRRRAASSPRGRRLTQTIV